MCGSLSAPRHGSGSQSVRAPFDSHAPPLSTKSSGASNDSAKKPGGGVSVTAYVSIGWAGSEPARSAIGGGREREHERFAPPLEVGRAPEAAGAEEHAAIRRLAAPASRWKSAASRLRWPTAAASQTSRR